MKIIFDDQIFSAQPVGGISKYFSDLAFGLKSIGEDVRLPFTFHINDHLQGHYNYIKVNIGKFTISKSNARRAAQLINILNIYRPDLGSTDIYHPTFYSERSLSRVGDSKFVTTIHDMIPERVPNVIGPSRHYRKRDHALRSDKIIAISEATKRDIIDIYDIPDEKIHVVHHGIDLDECKIIQTLDDLPDEYILFIGGRSGYKNFSQLLPAMAILNARGIDVPLVCIGKPFTPEELQSIHSLKLTHIMRMAATDEQVRYAYRRALFFVFPSRYEGFGIPLIEAMAQHTALAISDIPPFREVARDAAAYFDPNDPDSIADTMETLLIDPEKRRILSALGAARVADFSLETMVQRTLAVYRS